MGKSGPQSQWPPPQLPRSLCWHTPVPPPWASLAVRPTMGMPKAAASSAIQAAVFWSMVGWASQSLGPQLAKAHSSAWTATGLALDDVQALRSRVTYSPTVLGLSSMPTWLDTWELELPKKLPRLSMVRAPSAVWRTMMRTPEPPRLELLGDGIQTLLRLILILPALGVPRPLGIIGDALGVDVALVLGVELRLDVGHGSSLDRRLSAGGQVGLDRAQDHLIGDRK